MKWGGKTSKHGYWVYIHFGLYYPPVYRLHPRHPVIPPEEAFLGIFSGPNSFSASVWMSRDKRLLISGYPKNTKRNRPRIWSRQQSNSMGPFRSPCPTNECPLKNDGPGRWLYIFSFQMVPPVFGSYEIWPQRHECKFCASIQGFSVRMSYFWSHWN